MTYVENPKDAIKISVKNKVTEYKIQVQKLHFCT